MCLVIAIVRCAARDTAGSSNIEVHIRSTFLRAPNFLRFVTAFVPFDTGSVATNEVIAHLVPFTLCTCFYTPYSSEHMLEKSAGLFLLNSKTFLVRLFAAVHTLTQLTANAPVLQSANK